MIHILSCVITDSSAANNMLFMVSLTVQISGEFVAKFSQEKFASSTEKTVLEIIAEIWLKNKK